MNKTKAILFLTITLRQKKNFIFKLKNLLRVNL